MDPNTLNLITFIESMIGLAAKSFADLKAVIGGSSTKTVDEILADADATYAQIIQNAQQQLPQPNNVDPGGQPGGGH